MVGFSDFAGRSASAVAVSDSALLHLPPSSALCCALATASVAPALATAAPLAASSVRPSLLATLLCEPLLRCSSSLLSLLPVGGYPLKALAASLLLLALPAAGGFPLQALLLASLLPTAADASPPEEPMP